jgi:hypothetical protein
METDHPKDADDVYLLRCGFQDREGNWWTMFHDFHNVNYRARDRVAQSVQDNLESSFLNWNTFSGEL